MLAYVTKLQSGIAIHHLLFLSHLVLLTRILIDLKNPRKQKSGISYYITNVLPAHTLIEKD